jgi:hypothetical protein
LTQNQPLQQVDQKQKRTMVSASKASTRIVAYVSASEVEELQQEFWALNQLHELGFLFNEIKNYLPSFIKLFNLLEGNKLLGDGYISKFLRYADHDLPFLENKFQKLTGDVIELECKKKDLNNTIILWNAHTDTYVCRYMTGSEKLDALLGPAVNTYRCDKYYKKRSDQAAS